MKSKLLGFLSFLCWQVLLREQEKIFYTYSGPKCLEWHYISIHFIFINFFLFHFLRTSKMFKSGTFWWWWKNTNNWGCNATVQYWQWKTLTNFNLWWDSNTFGVTLSRIWKNRSEIFHGTFCIQWRPRCTLQELGEQENSWFVSKFLLDSREKSCHIFEICTYVLK